MAEPLIRTIPIVALEACLALMLSAAASAVLAEGLADPTRPPASLGATVSEENAGRTSNAGPVLQSVLIAPGRREAIISGQTVRLGSKFGEARVVSIAESEVVLRNGKDRQVLKLFPGMEKRVARRGTQSRPAAPKQERQGRE